MKKLILTILIMILTVPSFGSGNVEIVDEGFRVMSPDGTQIAFLSSEGLGTFENLKDNSLAVNTAVYTTAGKLLTTTAPATGTLGFWTRTTGPATLTTATAGDKIVTTGTVQGGTLTDGILSINSGSITSAVNGTFSGLITTPELLLNLGVPADHLQYKLQRDGNTSAIALSNTDTDAALGTIFRIYPPNAGDPATIQIRSNSKPGDSANNVRLTLTQTTTQASIFALKSGSGATPVFILGVGGNSNQTLDNNGNTTFGGTIIIPNGGFIESVGGSESIQILSTNKVLFRADVDIGSNLLVGADLTVENTVRAEINVLLNTLGGTTTLTQLTGPAGLCIDIDEKITHIRPNADMSGILWKIAGDIISPIDDFGNTYDVELGGYISSAEIGNQHDTTIHTTTLWGHDDGGGFENLVFTWAPTSVAVSSGTGITLVVWNTDFRLNDNQTSLYGNGSDGGIRFAVDAAWDNAFFTIGTKVNSANFSGAVVIGRQSQNDVWKAPADVYPNPQLHIHSGFNVVEDRMRMWFDGTDGNIVADKGGLNIFPSTNVNIGSVANKTVISATGDMSFAGGGGLLHGNMDQDGGVFTVFLESVDQLYELDAATTNISAGPLNDVTFPGNHYLEVKTAGVYKIDWSLICQISGLTGGSEHVEFEVLKNGNATGKGESHVTHKNTVRDFPLASTTLLDLAVDDEISIGATARDSSGKTITIDHLEMTIFMIGGT